MKKQHFYIIHSIKYSHATHGFLYPHQLLPLFSDEDPHTVIRRINSKYPHDHSTIYYIS